MPELPEVETIKNDLVKNIIGKNISQIDIIQRKSVHNNPDYFINSLRNNNIKNIERKGKYLFFELKDDKNYLLIHLRMTGQLVYKKHYDKTCVEKYSRVIICFSDDSALCFNDMRRLGYLEIISQKQRDEVLNNLGIDPLDKNFTFENLKAAIASRKATMKSVLLNQKIIAGIGNIYADEICFDAKIKPDRKVHTLNDEEIKTLYFSILKILKKAIKHRGTTFSDYVDGYGKKGEFAGFLKVYGRRKKKCLGCAGTVETRKIAGRTTHYCPACQK